ncbi:MAG TPA: glycerate kinase [Acidimicrobiales bacterium]|nr:glycerate kinase [Acidimicrobiales bacterium]
MPRLVAAPDTFREAGSALELALAVARAAAQAGWACEQVPVSDGGEGFCEVIGGRSRSARVHGPDGALVEAEWRLLDDGRTATVETALGSGLALVGGPDRNDAVAADSTGTGELIAEAVRSGARRVLVGMGGSASTDGGLGALDVLEPHSRLRGVELVVACDTSARFVDAASVFAEQKGASPVQVKLLVRRLERLAQLYRERHGVDVTDLPGAGAAGGLAGGLAALGASLLPGFDVVADAVDLAGQLEGADLVVTGEALIDEESWAPGRAVGGVARLAGELGVPVVVVAGQVVDPPAAPCIDLTERFGAERARLDAPGCVTEVVAELLARPAG